ncbi:hypothetical protein ACGFYP_22390 [Streptomyces sp. NPDC048370]|uniref:hypothetical protein n=1 Tax=Streptomyces sp. NPDC048370 TaxID=3365540 RepID=UPI0037158F74
MGRLWDKVVGTAYPDSGVVPLSAAEVRAALLAVDGPDVPFRVRNGLPAEKADLVAEWRVPELRMTLKTRMRLVPETREVRTLDERWEASTADSGKQYGRGRSTQVARKWSYEQGPDGRRRKVETFRFDSRDMRNPLLSAVLGAGWTWRGVLFRW